MRWLSASLYTVLFAIRLTQEPHSNKALQSPKNLTSLSVPPFFSRWWSYLSTSLLLYGLLSSSVFDSCNQRPLWFIVLYTEILTLCILWPSDFKYLKMAPSDFTSLRPTAFHCSNRGCDAPLCFKNLASSSLRVTMEKTHLYKICCSLGSFHDDGGALKLPLLRSMSVKMGEERTSLYF